MPLFSLILFCRIDTLVVFISLCSPSKVPRRRRWFNKFLKVLVGPRVLLTLRVNILGRPTFGTLTIPRPPLGTILIVRIIVRPLSAIGLLMLILFRWRRSRVINKFSSPVRRKLMVLGVPQILVKSLRVTFLTKRRRTLLLRGQF